MDLRYQYRKITDLAGMEIISPRGIAPLLFYTPRDSLLIC